MGWYVHASETNPQSFDRWSTDKGVSSRKLDESVNQVCHKFLW